MATSTHPSSSRRWWSLLALCALIFGLVSQQAINTATAAQTSNGTDDYAAQNLGAPWDMTDPSVFAFDYTRQYGGVTNLTLANGILSATSINSDPRVALLTPTPIGATPVPPEGGYRPVNTSLYRYLTVRVNVPTSSFAQVFWHTAQNAPFNASGFQAVNPGWNTLVFDLAAGGQGSMGSWSGLVQGLYFDPMMTAGTFQIDYVRLSGERLQNPENSPPALRITAPSYLSGPDYASEQLGNPWDMSDAADVVKTVALGPLSFDNGILTTSTGNCSSNCDDPQLLLNVGPAVDTSRYKYATYRMKMESIPGVYPESVARWLWWSSTPSQSSTSDDIVVYEGWRTVSIDLNKVALEAGSFATWANSIPTVFRFDPHEETRARAFSIDYILLTGDNTANDSFTIRYQASDSDGKDVRTQFFFDTDAQGFNGQPITCSTAAGGGATGKFNLFLPALSKPGASTSVVEGAACRWDTSNVPNGTYYIYGVADDGTNVTRTYSELPVIVQR